MNVECTVLISMKIVNIVTRQKFWSSIIYLCHTIINTILYLTADGMEPYYTTVLKFKFYLCIKKGPYPGTFYAQYLSYFLRLDFSCDGDLTLRILEKIAPCPKIQLYGICLFIYWIIFKHCIGVRYVFSYDWFFDRSKSERMDISSEEVSDH